MTLSQAFDVLPQMIKFCPFMEKFVVALIDKHYLRFLYLGREVSEFIAMMNTSVDVASIRSLRKQVQQLDRTRFIPRAITSEPQIVLQKLGDIESLFVARL